MTRITTTPAGLLLAALLLAGCAAKAPPEPPMAAMPAPAPDPATMLPSAEAKPVQMSQTVLPEGGELTKGPAIGVMDWAVHGTMDDVAWRFGPADFGFIRVAGKSGVEWQYIQVAESWGVQCKAEPATKATPCTVLRIQPLQPGSMASGGVALDQHLTCVRADGPGDGTEITVDGGKPHAFPADSKCLSGAESDALQQEMLAGTNIAVTAHFLAKGPSATISLPSYGMKQAMALRAWILDKYGSGDLSTE